MLNNTICDESRVAKLGHLHKGPPMRAVVGYKITTKNFDLTGIPITCTGRAPKLHLGLSFRLTFLDDAKVPGWSHKFRHGAAATGKDVSNDANILLHYDYDREKEDGYPEAHLHVCATSDAWKSVRRLDSERPQLEKLHLPVGAAAIPSDSLKDIIDFLVAERLGGETDRIVTPPSRQAARTSLRSSLELPSVAIRSQR